MSLVKTWYTLDEAESKFGIGRDQILVWVEEGVVRCETEGDNIARINVDDLELKMEEMLR